MILEAVWFKDGKEVLQVDPVLEMYVEDEIDTTYPIKVFNGHYWYDAADCDETPDDFVVRFKKEQQYGDITITI